MLNVKMHREVMLTVLRKIYTKEGLRSILGFKGGTAAMLFYDLPRFSVDLDFDLLDESKKEFVLLELKKILKPLGEVRDATEKYFTLFGLLNYEKGQRNLKIEISKRGSKSVYQPMNYLGTSMMVVTRDDMVACKMAALATRKKFATRDMYDTWYFLSNHWEMDEEVLRQQTEVGTEKSLQIMIERVKKVDDNEILEGLGELLTEKQKDWVKSKLKEELLFLLRLQLDSQRRVHTRDVT